MKKINFLMFSAVNLSLTLNTVLAAPLDFDGDGISETAGIEIQHDGSANELAISYLSSANGATVFTEFGKSSEAPAPADYDGDGITDLTAVGVGSDTRLLWRTKLSSAAGAISSSQWGGDGDQILSGCDFDNDKKADKAVIRDFKTLYAERSTDLTLLSLETGLDTIDRYSCGDLNADGKDELVIQTSTATGNSGDIIAYDLSAGLPIFSRTIATKIIGLLVLDSNGDGLKEIAYVRAGTSATRKIIFMETAADREVSVPLHLKVVSAKYDLTPGASDGLLLKIDSENLFVRYPHASDLSQMETIVIPRTASALSAVQASAVGTAHSREPACQVQHDPADGNQGFLWKPVSNTGTPAALLPSGTHLKTVRVLKRGKVIDRYRYTGNGNGGRDHWRGRKRASGLPADSTFSGTSKEDGLIHCWLIPEPTLRID